MHILRLADFDSHGFCLVADVVIRLEVMRED